MLKEWALVAFTVIGQMAVGTFLVAALPLFLSGGKGVEASARAGRLGVLAAVIGLSVLAAVLSLFHLHHPLRARRVLANLGTSWLSREIFFELGFMVLATLGFVLAWGRPAGGVLLKGILAAGGLAGVLFIVSMSKLYMLKTVPPWNQAYTPLSFFLTTLSLGALAAGLVMGHGERMPVPSGPFLLLALFLVAGDAAAAFLIAPGYGLFGHRQTPSLRPPAESHRALHMARLTLLLMGLAFLGAAMAAGQGRTASGSGGSGLLTAAFALVFAAEVAGRFLFYGLFGRPGR